MYFFLKNIVTLFYKKLRIKIVVSFLRESGPWITNTKCTVVIKCQKQFKWLCEETNEELNNQYHGKKD